MDQLPIIAPPTEVWEDRGGLTARVCDRHADAATIERFRPAKQGSWEFTAALDGRGDQCEACRADRADAIGRERDRPVGLVEIAELLQVRRSTVDQWGQRGLLPPREWTVGGRPAWRLSVIVAWAHDTGRL